MIRPGVTVVIDRTKALAQGIRELVGSRVLVGFPEGQEVREDGSGLNNATLAYIHNSGAPEAGIPQREFMESGIETAKKPITDWLGAAAKLALQGKAATVGAALSGAGIAGVSGIKGRIASGIPPPLKQSTVNARRSRRTSKMSAFDKARSDYRRKATKPEHTTPLIDTADMLGSVTYVIERKGNR